MANYKLTPISIAVHLEDDNAVFGESVTLVSLDDEAGGYFIKLTQHASEEKEVRIDFDELPLILEAIEMLKKGIE